MLGVEMKKKLTEWIIDVAKILLACALTFAISLTMFGKSTKYEREAEQERRLGRLEQTILTKEDLQEANCGLLDKINARFDEFELYLQGKYSIKQKQ
jgi:hypothetical protein